MFQMIIGWFAKPTAEEIAKRDYEECKRQLLKHEDALAYHTQMVTYYTKNTARLLQYQTK